MRRTRMEKPRRPVRARRYQDDTHAWSELLDPRDHEIVRAKHPRSTDHGGTGRT